MSIQDENIKNISHYIKENGNNLSFAWGDITDLKQIGQGGSSLIYAGKLDCQEVALKFYCKETQGSDLKRFKDEYFKIQSLENYQKTMLAAYLCFESITINNSVYYLYVMKRYHCTLKEFVREYSDDRISLYEKLLDFLLNALNQIHNNNIIHRDLKPENILMDNSGRFYLADFGIAKYMDYSITKPGDRLANYKFSAPEQSEKNGKITYASDIFSMGQLLYWILENCTLSGLTEIKNYENTLIKPLLEKCLKSKAEDRFQSIDEIEKFIKNEKQKKLIQTVELEKEEKVLGLLNLNIQFTDLIRKSYPDSDNRLISLDNKGYFTRILTNLNEFIEENLDSQDIWYNTGFSNQEISGIEYDENTNIIKIKVKKTHTILEFSLRKIWLYADISDYASLLLLDLGPLQPYVINGVETNYKSLINNEIEVDSDKVRSGYLDLGLKQGVISIESKISFERNFSDDRYYAIGPIYLAPIFYKNDNYLHKLQSAFLTPEILNEYICKIRKIKPDESYRFQ